MIMQGLDPSQTIQSQQFASQNIKSHNEHIRVKNESIILQVISFNVGGESAPDFKSLLPMFDKNSQPADIVVVGIQELI